MPIPWNADDPADQERLRENSREVLRRAVDSARDRVAPSVALAKGWHRGFYEGCSLPVPYYAGEIRDADPTYPELIDYEVSVGRRQGIPARRVPQELSQFEARMEQAVAALDAEIPSGRSPADVGSLGSVLTLAASAHGEWVRIHPFANGNGRTARVWANWCLVRYGLPVVVRLKPRPDGDAYALAALASMDGDHRPMIGVLNTMVQRRIRMRES